MLFVRAASGCSTCRRTDFPHRRSPNTPSTVTRDAEHGERIEGQRLRDARPAMLGRSASIPAVRRPKTEREHHRYPDEDRRDEGRRPTAIVTPDLVRPTRRRDGRSHQDGDPEPLRSADAERGSGHEQLRPAELGENGAEHGLRALAGALKGGSGAGGWYRTRAATTSNRTPNPSLEQGAQRLAARLSGVRKRWRRRAANARRTRGSLGRARRRCRTPDR